MEENPINPNAESIQSVPPSPNSIHEEKVSFLKSKWLKIGIVVVVLVLLLGGVYMLGRSSVLKELNPTNPTIPPPDEPKRITPTPVDETANWKTYTNSENDLGFKYPVSWIIKNYPADSSFNLTLKDKPFEFPSGATDAFLTNVITVGYTSSYDKKQKILVPDVYLSEEIINQWKNDLDPSSINTKKIRVNGKNAIQIWGIVGPGPAEGLYSKTTLIQLKNKVLYISNDNKDFEQVYNQILSSFKFTQ